MFGFFLVEAQHLLLSEGIRPDYNLLCFWWFHSLDPKHVAVGLTLVTSYGKTITLSRTYINQTPATMQSA